MKKSKYAAISVISSLAIIAIWAIASAALGKQIILPSPVSVARELGRLLGTQSFLKNIGTTVLRAFESFAVITVTGAVLGMLAGRSKVFERIMSPVVTVFKATPLMSVILLAFIWFRTGAVPVFSAFLMAFPVMFVQTMTGCRNIDERLKQMCTVYGIEGLDRIRNLVIPSLAPYLITGAKQTLSLVWKVVIAAEVLTLPKHGIGRSLQLAQIQLETSLVFAWTIVAIILTALGDIAFALVLKSLSRRSDNEN